MMDSKNPYSNGEGYADPTAYAGMKPIIQQETEEAHFISNLIHNLKFVVGLAGFEVVGRITLKEKSTGKIFK